MLLLAALMAMRNFKFLPMSDVQINIVGQQVISSLPGPKALNAMTIDMVTNMADALRSWVDDDNVHHVIITHLVKAAHFVLVVTSKAVSVIDHNPSEGATPYFKAEYGFGYVLG